MSNANIAKNSVGQSTGTGFIRIKRIRMVGFRSFDDYTLDIPPGLVFICGPNESGKTGIMKAIQLGLFTDASTTRQDVRQLTRWGRDEGFRIELTLENQDGQWDIIRDFDTGRNMLSKPDGTIERDKHRIAEIIAGLLGVPKEGAEAAYIASVCVLQDELASGGNDLKKLIENRVVGGGVDVMKLAGDAGKKISDLKAGTKGGTRQGDLTQAKNRVSELEARLRDTELRVRSGQEARTQAFEIAREMARLTEEVSILGQTLDKARRHAKAQEVYARESKELNSIYEQKIERNTLEQRLKAIEPEIKTLSETRGKLTAEITRKQRLDEIDRVIASAQGEMARLSELHQKAQHLLKEAEDAEMKAKGLALIDPEKVAKAEDLHRSLSHHKQVLAEDTKTFEQFKIGIDMHSEAIRKKSGEESRLSKLLAVKNLDEQFNSISAQIQRLEPAIEENENSRCKLAGLAPVSEQDVQEATRLSAEILAMGKVPAGLNVEVNAAPGAAAGGRLALDGNPPMDIKPGLAEFSALKRIEVNIPQIIDLKVNTTDAEEFLARMKEADNKLNTILKRYGVESTRALSEALDGYRKVQSEVAASHQSLANLVATVDTAQYEKHEGLCKTAKTTLALLRKQAERLKHEVSSGLSELGMELGELEKQQISEIEKNLQDVKWELQAEAHAMAKLKGSIDVLDLKKKEQEIQAIEGSIAALVTETGCVSFEDMVAKRDALLNLKKVINDRKLRAGDLLGDKTIKALTGEISVLDQKIRGLNEERCGILAKGSLPDGLEENLGKAQEELKTKESERDRILGKISVIDLEKLDAKQTEVLARLMPAQMELQETLAYKMMPEEIVQKERELDDKTKLLQKLGGEKASAEATVRLITEGAEDIAGVTEELEEAKRHLAHIEREVKILEVLGDTFPEARTRAVSGMFDLLSQSSSKYIGHMTAGRYSRMDLSEDLSPLLYSESRGGPIDALRERGLLSTGTADQVLLAVRLAVADLMSQGKCPPVIMDDPFVHFDPARRQAGIDALRQISGAYQVIVFTCHDYPEIAEEQKVDLSGRQSVLE